VLELICGTLREKSAPLIRALLSLARLENGWRAIFLAADCLREVKLGEQFLAAKQDTKHELEKLLSFDFQFPYGWADPEAYQVVAIRAGAAERLGAALLLVTNLRWKAVS
jgi:hypothetical protein